MALSANILINVGRNVDFKHFVLNMLRTFQPFFIEQETLFLSSRDFDWRYLKIKTNVPDLIEDELYNHLGSGLAFVYKEKPLSVFKSDRDAISIDLMSPVMLDDILVDFSHYTPLVNESIRSAGGSLAFLKLMQQQ